MVNISLAWFMKAHRLVTITIPVWHLSSSAQTLRFRAPRRRPAVPTRAVGLRSPSPSPALYYVSPPSSCMKDCSALYEVVISSPSHSQDWNPAWLSKLAQTTTPTSNRKWQSRDSGCLTCHASSVLAATVRFLCAQTSTSHQRSHLQLWFERRDTPFPSSLWGEATGMDKTVKPNEASYSVIALW